jgi:hypothetical protein
VDLRVQLSNDAGEKNHGQTATQKDTDHPVREAPELGTLGGGPPGMLTATTVKATSCQFSIRVTQGGSGNTGNAPVQIFLAIGVIELAALVILDGKWVVSGALHTYSRGQRVASREPNVSPSIFLTKRYE